MSEFSNRYRFSVIIPAYNVECYIEEAILSVASQDLGDIQIVVIDDNSEDDTACILRRLSSRCNLKIISNKQRLGPGACRNIGFSNASGQYILYLDGDDFFLEGLFSALRIILESRQPDLISFGHQAYRDGKIEAARVPDRKYDFSEQILSGNPACWGKAINRSFLINNLIRFPVGLRAEDIFYTLQIAKFVKTYELLEGVYYSWRIVNGSDSRSPSFDYLEDYIQIISLSVDLIMDGRQEDKSKILAAKFVHRYIENLISKIRLFGGSESILLAKRLGEILNNSYKILALSSNIEEIDKASGYVLSGSKFNYFLPRRIMRGRLRRFTEKARVKFRNLFGEYSFTWLTVRVLWALFVNRPKKIDLVVTEQIETEGALLELLTRISWYFLPFGKKISKIYIFLNEEVDKDFETVRPLNFCETAYFNLDKIRQKVIFIKSEQCALDIKCFDKSTKKIGLRYYVNRRSHDLAMKFLPTDTLEIDISPESANGASNILWLYTRVFGENPVDIIISRVKLILLKILPRKKKVVLLGTGPSVQSLYTSSFEDADMIICNSLVSSPALDSWKNIKFVVCADPIFHAGVSQYAEHFRRDLARLMSSTDAYLFVPLRDYHIYKFYLPRAIRYKIIPLPFSREKNLINIELNKDPSLAITSNVLTLMLLPVAGYLYKKIIIGGCDGRPLHENQYYWRHSSSAQYSDKMAGVRSIHPGFFEIDFDEYYLKHCFVVDRWIQELEIRGKRIEVLTSSYIPSLRDRIVGSPSLDVDREADKIYSAMVRLAESKDWHNGLGTYSKR